MKVLLFNFRKNSSSCKGGRANGITTTVTKRTTFQPLLKRFVMIVLFMLSGIGFAQTDTYMYWDASVGCTEFDYAGDPKRKLEFIENIEDAPCLRVCEGSQVHYFIEGSNIASVDWQATGGTVQNTWTSPHKARVQWGLPGNGAITVTITYTDNTVKTYTLCVEIINSPKAYFKVDTLEEPVFCLETPIVFDNLSFANGGTDIMHYFWDFGDGNYSSEFEPVHSYSSPGTYTVELTVTNKCNCSSTYKMDIIITEKMTVNISCPGVVCEGDKAIYTANDNCGGRWHVEGGSISSGGTGYDYVEVAWDNVDPEEGFGYIYYQSSCGCPYWITEKVPVVLKTGEIKGNPMICLGSQNRYTLPQWPTTEFNWSLVNDTSPSQIVLTDQRNEVIVEGLEPGIYTLHCDYYNTLLGCVGNADFQITVAPEIEITGDEAFCSGTSHNYTNSTGVPVNWKLKLNSSTVSSSTGANFSYNFTTGGTYVLTATSLGGCNSEPFIIEVTQTPATPTGTITGETWVCSGVTYDYSYSNTVPGTVLVWDVTGSATIQGSNTGNNISVTFSGTGPYQVKVKRVSTDGLLCESGWLTLNVAIPDIDPLITNNNGLTVFCPSSVAYFTVDLGGVVPDLIEWEVLSDAIPPDSNFGNIIDGVNSPMVTVSWNEISTSPTGKLYVHVTRCGVTISKYFEIVLYEAPDLGITAPSTVCANTPFDITLTSSSTLTAGTITWTVNGQTYIRNIATQGLTLTGVVVDNITTGNMSIDITASVALPNGCFYDLMAFHSMTIKPRPDVQITPGYYYTVCLPGTFDITLHANVNNAAGLGTPTFEWFKDDISLGITTSSIDINNATQPSPGGTYHVVVTANDCSTVSGSILIVEDCPDILLCSLNVNPDLYLEAHWTACNKIEAEAIYNTGSYVTSIEWIYPPSLMSITGQGTDTPYFTTDVPGQYQLFAQVTYQTTEGPCVVIESVLVSKLYKAKFDYTVTCNGNNDYTVELFSNSTLFGLGISDVDFDYSSSGGTLTPTPGGAIITNLTGGSSYTFTLDLQDSLGIYPVCTYVQTLNLPGVPSTAFTMIAGDPHCAEAPIELTITGYNAANTYIWDFDNTSYIASGPTTLINITNLGNKAIQLFVHNPYGCVFTENPKMVDIKEADFAGEFDPEQVNICEGESFPGISFIQDGGDSVLDEIIWMRGNQPVTPAPGLTFTPTQSGLYWAVLIDADGCRFNGMAANPVPVTIRKKPYVSITGENSLCGGESTTLQGVITDSSLERRWLIDDSPAPVPVAGAHGVWNTTSALLSLEVSTTNTYILEVRPVGDPDCGNSASFPVTVHPAVTVPLLDYQVMLCEPYEVKIWVTNFDSAGNYNWSDGQDDGAITVYQGGVYGVTYTAPTGCMATAEIMVPHNTDRYMWTFPTGCFDVCPWDEPAPYIVGPWGTFDLHEWLINDNVVQSGVTMAVSNLMVSQPGAYQLYIENEDCEYESGIAFISPNPESEGCQIMDCDPKMELDGPIYVGGGQYHFNGYFANTFGIPITVTFTSLNGYGTYSPASITIPIGGTYYFSPLWFTSNPGFDGGDDYIIISIPEIPCMTAIPVRFVPEGGGYRMMTEEPIADQPELRVTPNPADVLAVVSYNLGTGYSKAESITVYTAEGRLITTIKLTKNSGDILLDTEKWSSGTYIISLQADGKTVLHQKLIKK